MVRFVRRKNDPERASATGSSPVQLGSRKCCRGQGSQTSPAIPANSATKPLPAKLPNPVEASPEPSLCACPCSCLLSSLTACRISHPCLPNTTLRFGPASQDTSLRNSLYTTPHKESRGRVARTFLFAECANWGM